MLTVTLSSTGTEVWIPGIVILGLVVGFLSGMFGVGGGFLLTPVLKVVFGIPYPVAVGSDLAQIFINSCLSTFRHWRNQKVDLKLGIILAAGALCGAEIGVRLLNSLGSMGELVINGRVISSLDLVLSLLFLLLLSSVAIFILKETAGRKTSNSGKTAPRREVERKVQDEAEENVKDDIQDETQADVLDNVKDAIQDEAQDSVPTALTASLQRIRLLPVLAFPTSRIEAYSLWVPLSLSFFVGILTGLMGVGGGFINFPLLIYVVGVPTHIAIGTSAFQILFASGYGALRHGLHGNVDLLLVGLLFLGSVGGVQLGVKASQIFGGKKIRRYFALVIMVGIAVILWDLFRNFFG